MISHAMVAFGAPVLGFVVLAFLGLITVRSEKRHRSHVGSRPLFLKASRVTYHPDAR